VRGTSQFWQGPHKVKHYKWGAIQKDLFVTAIQKVRDDKSTFFWHDVWLEDTTLQIQYENFV